MGIDKLLERGLCTFVDKKITIQSISAQGYTRAAVDSSGWTHEGLYRVSVEYCDRDRNAVIEGVCKYYQDKLDMLGRAGLKHAVLVFDGARLPGK